MPDPETAGVASTESASTVSQAGAGAGGAQAGVGAEQRAAQTDVGMDIGQTEAYTLNLKTLVDDNQINARRVHNNGADFDAALRNVSLQALQNAVQASQRINADSIDSKVRLQHYAESEVARTVRHSDLAIDRQWNIDEVSASVAKNPVFQDAIAGAVAAGVAAAINSKPAASA